MDLNLNDFIKIYDNTLNKQNCEILINLFEEVSKENEPLNLTDNKDISEEIKNIHNEFLKIVVNVRNEYYEYCYGKIFPDMNSFEKFKIIKYLPSDNQQEPIVDIRNYDDARRFLCFNLYLNDNSSGQTKFLNLTIQPKVGTLLVYPPFWMYPHQEISPTKSPKYVLKTYLHYK